MKKIKFFDDNKLVDEFEPATIMTPMPDVILYGDSFYKKRAEMEYEKCFGFIMPKRTNNI